MSNQDLSDDELAGLEFETAMEKLEALIAAIDTDNLSVEQMMRDFDTGVRLAGHCRAILDDAQRQLTQVLESGEEVPFE